ncbi:MAG: hypothetical protein RMJ33_02665 [Saprospiraceae bacterium]|nr:hypothetical protein [Saprospiraceae bacterium]MDW8228719.1 hypothetical protein [Saprospiraceae bacterium]
MRLHPAAERPHLRRLLAQAHTEALLEAARQANLPDADAWTERLSAAQGAYESQRIDFDVWLREHVRVFRTILEHTDGALQRAPSPPASAEIEALILQKRIEEALKRCQDDDETLLLHAQYALGRREFEAGRLDLAQWEMLQHRIGYALVAFLEEKQALQRKSGCLGALFRRR